MYSQTNIRLPSGLVSKIKAQAKKHNLSYSAMCEQILEGAVSMLEDNKDYHLLSGNALRAKVDIENSRKRSETKRRTS